MCFLLGSFEHTATAVSEHTATAVFPAASMALTTGPLALTKGAQGGMVTPATAGEVPSRAAAAPVQPSATVAASIGSAGGGSGSG